MKRHSLIAACLGLAALSLGAGARADQVADIKARGELICGTLGTSQPFSFQDATTRQLVGYDVDMCKLVADKLGVKVSYKLLSVAARVPELNEGRVDILAANLGYSPDRAQQIAFSHAYYVSPQKLLVRKDSGLDTIESLNGRRVGATKGSSSEREIKRILDKSQVIGYGDSSATYLALQQKKVDAQFVGTGAGAPGAAEPADGAGQRDRQVGVRRAVGPGRAQVGAGHAGGGEPGAGRGGKLGRGRAVVRQVVRRADAVQARERFQDRPHRGLNAGTAQ